MFGHHRHRGGTLARHLRPPRAGHVSAPAGSARPSPVGSRPAAAPGRPARPARLPVEYVLPLRRTDDAGLDELTGYLRELRRWVDVTVVDGSPPVIFARHAAAWRGLAGTSRPTPRCAAPTARCSGC